MICRIFFSALAIRWIYALTLFATMGDAGLKGVDSYGYTEVAQKFVEMAAAGSIHGWDWLGTNPTIMPLYNAMISASLFLFGKYATLGYVLAQGLFDSATCVLVYRTADALAPRAATAAAIAAVVNPTQIVMSGMLYPDTPFVFFVALFTYGTVRWLQMPSSRYAILIAVGLGGGALIRILLVPWAAVLVLFLFGFAAWRSGLSKRLAGGLAAILVIVGVCAGAVLARNVAQFGAWSLTSQGGIHLVTVVPWVGRAYDGTPWVQGRQTLIDEINRRYPQKTPDPFVESRRYTEVAEAAWQTYGTVPTVKAWLIGAAINMASPAIILSPPLIQIPRTGFYETPGASMTQKITNFLFHSESALYGWALLTGIAGLVLVRLVQSAGFVGLLIQAWRERGRAFAVAVLFVMWSGFILAVNGPVASPKYRLPLEPMLNILTGMGFLSISRWRKGAADPAR